MFARRTQAAVVVIALTAVAAYGQVSPQDRAEIVRLQSLREGPPEDLDSLFAEVEGASARGLPERPLVNKIKEGVAKGVPTPRIGAVLRDMTGRLEAARSLLDGRGPAPGETASSRARAIEILGDALSRGVTRDDVLAIDLVARGRGGFPRSESLASAASGLAILEGGGFPASESRSLVGEALREGFRDADLLDLARGLALQRRERPERPPSIEEVRAGIARGDRAERLLPPERPPSRPVRTERGRPEKPHRP